MGHLINPISARLCVNRVWSSNWVNFTNSNYSYLFINDLKLNLILKFLLQDFVYINLGLLYSHFTIINNLKGLFVCIYFYDSNLEYIIRLKTPQNREDIHKGNISKLLVNISRFYVQLDWLSPNFQFVSVLDQNYFYEKFSQSLNQKLFNYRKLGLGSIKNKQLFYYIQLSCYYFLFKNNNNLFPNKNIIAIKRNILRHRQQVVGKLIKQNISSNNLFLKSNLKFIKYRSSSNNNIGSLNVIRSFFTQVKIDLCKKKYYNHNVIIKSLQKETFLDNYSNFKANNIRNLTSRYSFFKKNINTNCVEYVIQKIFIECVYLSILKKIKKLLLKKLFKYNFFIKDLYFVIMDIKGITAHVVTSFMTVRLAQDYSINEVLNLTKRRLIKTRGLKGFRIKCSGRFSRKQRASTFVTTSNTKFVNKLPLSNPISYIDYSFNEVTLKYGRCSIKVWLFISNELGLVPYHNAQLKINTDGRKKILKRRVKDLLII